ncbi:unnamed protein product [Prunus brigantina]
MGDISLLLNEGSSTSTPQIVTIQSDNSSLLAGVTLTETNNALWSQVMEMRITAPEKVGYLTGDTSKSPELSSTSNKWCTENFRVKRWLIDSKGEILCKDPKLDLNQTFAYVTQQRITMTGAQEDSIMVTQHQMGPQNSTSGGGSSQNKSLRSRSEKKCTHCGGDKHTCVGCYDLIGFGYTGSNICLYSHNKYQMLCFKYFIQEKHMHH